MNTYQVQDFQKFSQVSSDATMKFMGDWAKNWQTIATEMTEYSKRAFQDGQATFQQVLAAKSVEQALEIQTSYAKRSIESYMQQMNKIGGMYSSLGREAYKPLESAVQSIR